MSTAEESPAQKAARMRRERREAKIKEGGAARLDKITSMSGRTPASLRDDDSPAPSPSPSPQPPTLNSSVPEPAAAPPQIGPMPAGQAPNAEAQIPEDIQAQQEYFRALLRQSAPDASQQGPEEDPTVKLLNSLMGGMPGGDPSAVGVSAPGSGPSQADLPSALGLPPFVADMLGAATRQQTDAEKKDIQLWKMIHVLFSIAVGIYLLFTISTSFSTFGSRPPPPATVQSPFMLFTTGELLLTGARIMMKGRNGGQAGLGLYFQAFRDIIRDGSLALFLLGMGTWWHREWMS